MYPGANVFTRARLLGFDDSGDFQTANFRGFAGETYTKVHRIQPHGFSSHPPADAVGLMLRMGESDRALAFGFETPGRPRNVPQGGTALYDQHGNVLKMVNTGVELAAPDVPLVIKAKTLRFEGDYGVIEANASGIFHNGKNIGEAHTHGGIARGGADTDPPNP
jgi:phage gp45-like